MANPWDAERTVSAELARELIESTFPELRPVRIEFFGAGWDNTAFLVGGELVFRFPRRQIAVPLLNTEMRVLPELATRLPLPIPVPKWIGYGGDDYPWPFAGYQRLRGVNAFAAQLNDEARLTLARPLARFLAVLHAVPLADAERYGIGPDEFGRFDIERLALKIHSSLDDLVARKVIDNPRLLLDLIDSAKGIATAGTTTTVVHGDLHAEHLVVDGNELSGIIDWGDIHCGHPAGDLSIAWTFFPPRARDVFLSTYGSIDDETVSLARFRALRFAIEQEAYGRDRGDADLIWEARRTLLTID